MIAKNPEPLIFQRGPGIHFPKRPTFGLLFFWTHYFHYDTNHKPCDFLQKDGSCLLGDCKPVNCAEFPFTARPDRWASLLGIVSNASVCPVLFEMLEILKDEYGFV